ncbi:MAG: hypothetical protein ABI540_08180 [Spartobacteria bacterium]
MKSSHPVVSVKRLSRHDSGTQRHSLLQSVVCELQPRRDAGFSFDGGGPARRPGFSRLAREVLLSDASRSFRLETAVLGFVTLVSLWPIAIMIHEVVRLLK